MPNFSYKARPPSGAVVTGVIDAQDQRSALEKLKSQRLIPIEVSEQKATGVAALIGKINPFKPSVKSNDIVLFSRQLSTMVSAGVPIVQGLSILSEQIENPAFRVVVTGIKEDIESGVSMPDAMRKHPKAFSELYVSMIKAGDEGGILDTILQRLSQYMESSEELKGKVKGALTMPAVIGFIAVSVVIFLLVFVLPTFKSIFASFGAELPLPTRLLMNLSDLLTRFFYLVVIIPISAFFGFKQALKVPKFRFQFDGIILKAPMFGIMLRKVAIAKFSRTLGTLIKSGVPIMQALDTVAKTSGNMVLEKAIMTARDEVKKGEHMVAPLKKSGQFPPMVIQMISVGEQTGNLDTMLVKIADFYDSEVDVAVKSLTSMIEPLVMAFLGVVIGGIVIAMFLPMFEMSQLVGN
ncbi:MAG: type II secretion system F family protein [Endomicrobiia bacterium]|nr:type II secretion system F family protein [Endomicrobiia bacterium]